MLGMNHATLGETVFSILRDRILTGVLKPGDRLLYNVIAAELSVSLTPIKEALLRLEQEGLIQIIPRKGAFVAKIGKRDAIEYTHIRLALESMAVETICQENGASAEETQMLSEINDRLQHAVSENRIQESLELDNEFHKTLVSLSGNSRLLEIIGQMPLLNICAAVGAEYYVIRSGKTIVNTHAAIVEAVRQRDAVAAKQFLKDNILTPILSILSE